jgi:hypothetical protein
LVETARIRDPRGEPKCVFTRRSAASVAHRLAGSERELGPRRGLNQPARPAAARHDGHEAAAGHRTDVDVGQGSEEIGWAQG